MGDEFRIRRDVSILGDGSLFGRRRRKIQPWQFGLWLLAMAVMGVVIWRFNDIQPRVLALVGTAPTPTPTAVEFARRGDLAFWRGDLNAAIAHYRSAAALTPSNPDVLYELARMLLYRSYDARNEKDPTEAEQWATRSVDSNPTSSRAYTILCFALVRIGKYEEAVQSCLRALDLNRNDADAHAYLSLAYLELDRADVAFEEADKAVKLNPDSIDAQTAYALTLETQRRFETAVEHYQRARSINPRLEFPYFNLAGAAYRIAVNRGDSDGFQAAIDAYNQVLSINKTSVRAYTNLCFTYFARGEPNLARDNCQTATTIDPGYTPAWRWLGELYYRKSEYEEAIRAFEECAKREQALSVGSRQVECWVYRGLAYRQLEQCDKAMPVFADLLSWTDSRNTIRLANLGVDGCNQLAQRQGAPQASPTPSRAAPSGTQTR